MHWYYEKMSERQPKSVPKHPKGTERSIKNPWNRNSPPILGYILGGK